VQQLRLYLYPAIVTITLLWALAVAIWPAPDPPTDAEWDAAEQAVDRTFRPGDAVLVHPGWLGGAGRRFAGRPLLLGPPTTQEESLRFTRFLVISTDDSLPAGLAASGDPAEDLGRLTLRTASGTTDAGDSPDLFARLPEARVRLVRGGRAEACGEWRAGAWHCPGPAWNYVGPTEMSIAGKTRTCLWAHPRGGAELVVSFPSVHLGRALTGHYGLSDSAATTPGGHPVRFEVALDGEKVLERKAPNRVGWRAFRIDTADRVGALHEVSFHISTRHDGKRHFCFDAAFEAEP